MGQYNQSYTPASVAYSNLPASADQNPPVPRDSARLSTQHPKHVPLMRENIVSFEHEPEIIVKPKAKPISKALQKEERLDKSAILVGKGGLGLLLITTAGVGGMLLYHAVRTKPQARMNAMHFAR